MWRELLSTAYRSISKNRNRSAINIFTLAIGIASLLFVSNMVLYEVSYDKSIANLYRVERLNDSGSQDAFTSSNIAPGLVEELDYINGFVRFIPFSEYRSANLRYLSDTSDFSAYFKRAYYVDPEVVDFFQLELLTGEIEDFGSPGSMIISQSKAINLFGLNWKKAIGTVLKKGRGSLQHEFTLVGVYADRQPNTHIDFDLLIAMSTPGSGENSLDGHTYVSVRNIPSMNVSDSIYLRPVTEIHTAQGISNESEPVANRNLLILLLVVAIITLLITISNYINNTIIHFVDRCKEVGIRKLHGAPSSHLMARLIIEILFINLITALLALGMFSIGAFLVHHNGLMTYPPLQDMEWEKLLLILLGTIVTNTFISAVYPFIFLNKIEIISALKGAGSLFRSKAFGQAGNVVRALLIFQIVASVVFLSSSMIIYRQLQLLGEQPQESEVRITGVFPGMSGANEQFAQLAVGFLEEMSDYGTIQEYAFSNLYKGQIRSEQKIMFEDSMSCYLTVVDPIVANESSQLISGDGFNYLFGYSPGKVMLDSILAKPRYGYNDSSKIWNIKGGKYQTVGVLKRDADDVPRAFVSGFRYLTYVDLVLNYDAGRGDRLNQFLEKTEYMISTRFPYFFLMRRDQQASGKAEEEVLALFIFFGGVSIFVSIIGLFGLSYFVTEKKSREVGIRKVHGASPVQILTKLLVDFGKLVVFGGVLAIPLVYFGGNLWLQNYARRIELDVSIYLLPIVGISLITLLTVLDKCWKSAILNPVDILEER